MKNQYMWIAGLLLVAAVARGRATPAVPPQVAAKYGDPGNWYLDQWARLFGVDLTLDGEHSVPSGLDPWGGTPMGWNG
jgi:hypothetical protein